MKSCSPTGAEDDKGEKVCQYQTPTTVYVKLHVGDPGETGASNPASNNTTRKAASFTTSTTGTLATDADLEWTAMTAEGSQVSHISIWDDVTAGNCLWTGSLTSAKTIGSNDTFKIPSGSLTISLD